MKVERKVSDFSAEKRKRKGNMETETEFLQNGNKYEIFLAETEIETEQRFSMEQTFPPNAEFPF